MRNNRLLSLIALLLIATLLLASCADPGNEEGKGDGGDSDTTVVSPLKEAADKWAEYISYVAPESTPIYTATRIDTDKDSITNVLQDFVVAVETESVYVTPEAEPAEPGDGSGDPAETPVAPNPIATEYKEITKWYSKDTGALVKTFVERAPVINAGKVHESIDLTEMVEYNISYYNDTGLIEVAVFTLTLKEAEPVPEGETPAEVDLYDVNNYDSVYTYDYYHIDGTEFKRGLKEQLVFRSADSDSAINAGRYLLDSEELGKTFLMDDGELVREFAYMMEYDVPVYDEESINFGGEGYAYFEKGGNKYVITEAAHQQMPLGELYLVLVPGISISVTDANDKALANYSAECYGIAGYAVLSNGNIYICEYELLKKDATEYDVKSGEDKLNVNHKIISITDGSVSTLDKSFKVSKIFNDTTKEIRSFLNLTTMEVTDPADLDSALLKNVDVDDGYMLAEIQKYADGVLDTNTVFAVLNESLEIVAELPKLVANQFTYPSFVDADTMVVSTRTANNRMVYYGIDTAEGEIFVLPALSKLINIEPVTNGYVWWNYDGSECKVYGADWKLLRDFTEDDGIEDTDYVDFSVINGNLYFHIKRETTTENEYTYDVVRLEITKSIYDGVETYNTWENSVLSSAHLHESGALIIGESGDVYNLSGQSLVDTGESARYESVYDEDINGGEGGTLDYYGDVTLDYVYETDAGYVIRTIVEWSRNEYASSPSEMPLEYTDYEYIVIK